MRIRRVLDRRCVVVGHPSGLGALIRLHLLAQSPVCAAASRCICWVGHADRLRVRMWVALVSLLDRATVDGGMSARLHAARDERGVLLERIASGNICCSITAWD